MMVPVNPRDAKVGALMMPVLCFVAVGIVRAKGPTFARGALATRSFAPATCPTPNQPRLVNQC